MLARQFGIARRAPLTPAEVLDQLNVTRVVPYEAHSMSISGTSVPL